MYICEDIHIYRILFDKKVYIYKVKCIYEERSRSKEACN